MLRQTLHGCNERGTCSPLPTKNSRLDCMRADGLLILSLCSYGETACSGLYGPLWRCDVEPRNAFDLDCLQSIAARRRSPAMPFLYYRLACCAYEDVIACDLLPAATPFIGKDAIRRLQTPPPPFDLRHRKTRPVCTHLSPLWTFRPPTTFATRKDAFCAYGPANIPIDDRPPSEVHLSCCPHPSLAPHQHEVLSLGHCCPASDSCGPRLRVSELVRSGLPGHQSGLPQHTNLRQDGYDAV
jgi:hypothetical protein